MMSIEQVSSLIRNGQKLFLAGSESLLRKLPQGDWIGGTIPYFMTEDGGRITHDLIQVTKLPAETSEIKIESYSTHNLMNLPGNYYANGFTFIIIPAFSDVHQTFAKNCSAWPGIFNQPLVGWITGVDLKEKNVTPKVFDGRTGQAIDNKALAMHVKLKEGSVATANIINIFEQGQGDTIRFPKSGFDVSTAYVNGQEVVFSDYLNKNKVDLKLPLVADYMGAKINVSIRDIDENSKNVRLFAPVFPDVNYKVAKPVDNYEEKFIEALKKEKIHNPLFACNCILNFMYANLEGKKSGGVNSAMTFGEVAYMLLNQTMVYITITQK